MILFVDMQMAKNTPAANPVAKAKIAKTAVKQGVSAILKKKSKVHHQIIVHRPKTLELKKDPKYKRKSVPTRPKFDKYRVVKFPLTTESAIKLIEDHNTLTFICDVQVNKFEIKKAIEELYDVKVAHVNTLIRPVGDKKAFVKLGGDAEALDVANKIGII